MYLCCISIRCNAAVGYNEEIMTFGSEFDRERELAVRIARQAGNMMLNYFDGKQQREIKADGTPVTIADKLINSMAIQEILKVFPDDGIVGEEESANGRNHRRLWFCDPIDGTKPFTWGVPTSVFSLGLVVDGTPVLGVVYDPYLDKLYEGIAGLGSYCNDRKLQVSRDDLKTGFIIATGSVERMVQSPPLYLKRLVEAGVQMACFSGGIYKSTLVAKGKMAGYIESKVSPHDLAAIDVIVTEAGGRVSTMSGEKLDYINGFTNAIISNGIVHDELVRFAS
jgi:fructose-1,6-bisphosphatase/inositol monophosphatase family enzyme